MNFHSDRKKNYEYPRIPYNRVNDGLGTSLRVKEYRNRRSKTARKILSEIDTGCVTEAEKYRLTTGNGSSNAASLICRFRKMDRSLNPLIKKGR